MIVKQQEHDLSPAFYTITMLVVFKKMHSQAKSAAPGDWSQIPMVVCSYFS